MYSLSAECLTTLRYAGASEVLIARNEVPREFLRSSGAITSLLCWEVVASIILLATAIARAQTPSTDPIERSIALVDQSTEAVDLYNQGKYADALAMFKALIQTYPEQDTDGLAVLGMGDSLAALGKIEEAK